MRCTFLQASKGKLRQGRGHVIQLTEHTMHSRHAKAPQKQLRLFCLGCFFSLAGTSGFALDCTFWGDFAGTIYGDYATRVGVGIASPVALGQTADMLDFDDKTPGTMNHVFLGAVLASIQSGSPREVVNKVGRDVCLSYPAGTFDPDSGE